MAVRQRGGDSMKEVFLEKYWKASRGKGALREPRMLVLREMDLG